MNKRLHEILDFFSKDVQASEWKTFLSLLLGGLVAALIVRQVCIKIIFKKLKTPEHKHLSGLSAIFEVTLPVVVFLYFLNIGLDVFKEMPPWLWAWKARLIPLICSVIVTIMGWRCIDFIVKSIFGKIFTSGEAIDDHLCNAIGRVIKVVFVLFVGLFVLNNMGFQVLSLITGLSFLGAAVALATQSTIGNIIGGLEILADRLFKQGDRICFGDFDGFVIKRGLRSVALKSIYGEVINIPNKDLVDKQIRNFTRTKNVAGKLVSEHRLKTDIGLVYHTTTAQITRAKEILLEISLTVNPGCDPQIVFRKLGSFSLDFELIQWVKYFHEEDLNALLNQINLAVKERFDAEGLEFAFPTQTVQLTKKLSL